ncbi:PD-(D/E)XK nuclease family protein [bacterium]|nr:PD-(D/E)XK nuclease family protein [bacterium]
MSHSFVQQLAELTRTYPYHNKWVLVPSHEVGWTLAERLLLEGHNWLNLRFQTPLQLALDSAGPYLWAQGIEACPRQLGPGCLHSLPEHPYTRMMSQPGMDLDLWDRLRRYRLQGEVWDPFDRLFEQLLRKRSWADEAQVYNCPAPTRVSSQDLVVLYPDHPWPALVQSFVRRLPGKQVCPAEPIPAQPSTSFFCAARRDFEFEEVLARLEGPVDQFEVVARPEDIPLLHDLLCQHQIPATFAFGLPLMLSRPAQALRDFLVWLSQGVSGYQFRELLMSNLAVAPPSSWVAARLLAAAGIRWGRQDYTDRLEALESRCLGAEHSTWQELQAGQARQLRQWFERLFERFPVRPDGTIPFPVWVDGLIFVVREYLDAHDPEATDVVLDVLEDFRQVSKQNWELAQFRQHLMVRLESRVWRTSRPRPGHLHVTRWQGIGLSGRPFVFLTGQEEESDESDALPQLRGHLTLSYALRCREGEREQFPHPRFLDFHGPGWEPRPLEPRPWDLPRAQFPDLARGMQAQLHRQKDELTEYDGYVPEAILSPPTSASGLQSLAACPFRFFLSRGLKIYPQPLPEPSRQSWLSPMEQGHVLHQMFAGWVDHQCTPLELLEQALFPQPPAPAAWLEERERAQLLAHFEHFTRLEPGPEDQTRCEVPFDLMLELPDGLQLHLRGCIDRVDHTDQGLRVVDYKTGRTFHLPESACYLGGRHLQHALYALAAQALFQQPVCQSGYLPTHPLVSQIWRAFPSPDPEELSRLLRLVLQPLQNGAFVQSHRSQEDCLYCDFQAACVGRQARDLKKKLASPLLESRRQLLEAP